MKDWQHFPGFVAVGLVSTVLNLSSRYVFQFWMSYEWALVGANVVGVLSAYLLNRQFVFKLRSGHIVVGLVRFAAVNIVGIAISWVTAVLLYRSVFPAVGLDSHADLIAHAIGIIVPVLPNYIAHKAWTFNQSSRR